MHGHGEFARAYRGGRRYRRGALTVLVMEGPPGPPTVGFVAGKKIGSAVVRNRVKRRMREAAARSGLKADTVYVLIADSGALNSEFHSLVEWIGSAAEADAAEEMR